MLATLDREWEGIIAHRDYPMISIDNNIAERAIRGPVVTRKNACGSHNGNTAGNAARMFTVTATARMAAEHPDLAHRLPRRMRPPRRKTAHREGAGTVPALDREPGRPPHLGPAPAIRIRPADNTVTGVEGASRRVGCRHALSQDLRRLTLSQHSAAAASGFLPSPTPTTGTLPAA